MNSNAKIKLLLLALVFFGPMIAAYVYYFYGQPRELPIVPNEQRTLLNPAVPLPAVPGRDAAGEPVDAIWAGPKWTLAYARTAPCDDTCQADLIRLAQVHIALNRDQNRVQRAYLGPSDGTPSAEELSLRIGRIDGPEADALLTLLESAGVAPDARGRVYVVDPLGNLVLSYPADVEQKGLHDDLDRLLDLSQIG